jgi:peptide/nickel transport system substrate-binding protein
MNERELRRLIGDVKTGRLSRRGFVQRMMAVGLAAPMATQLLAISGVAMAQSMAVYKPTKRGGGGALKVLWWQGPTLLNPHFAVGTKDQDGSRLFYEPLAGWDPTGNLKPVLAASIPGREDGTLAADGKSVIWKLKQGVTWHDGKPFTADDVVFNWEYAKDPATAATTNATYKDVMVEKVDPYTVVVKFQQPTPFWADAFIGTRGEINTNYHMENRPYFDSIEMKGGGDAVSAARAVLQTGEFDFAWNMQVEDEVLSRLEKGSKGRVVISEGGNVEHIQLNTTDPWTEVDGERSSLKTKHPILSDTAVRQALALLVDKASIEKYIYGRTGLATANFINNPERFRSKITKYEFNVDKASDILEKAGWAKGSDGIRAKDGKKLKFVYQTSINQPRQKTQAIVKQACQKAGIDIEVKAVTSSVYFSSDVANPDTYTKFYTDLQMYTVSMTQPDPEVFMMQFLSWEAASKENKWQGRNITRWQNKEYDDIFKAAQTELDPVKRAAMLIKLNEMVVNNQVVIPVVGRPSVVAMSSKLVAAMSGWDNNTWDIQDWYKEG